MILHIQADLLVGIQADSEYGRGASSRLSVLSHFQVGKPCP
jgi:hypothetical protein